MISFFNILPTCAGSALPEPFTNMLAADQKHDATPKREN